MYRVTHKVLRKEHSDAPAPEPVARQSAAPSNDAAATPSSCIDRIRRQFIALALFAALAANAAQAPGPWGIDDPHIAAGVLRTEYNDPRAGTDGHSLDVDCAASGDPATCGEIQTVFRASNSYTNAAVAPGATYWMLTINNDKSFVERCEQYGPPDQSIPIDVPGAGLIGVGVTAGPMGKVIDLEVDQVDYRNPCGSVAAPFVGFGAHWGRGNSTPVGYLNAEGSVTTFDSRLVEFASPGGFLYARHWLFAIATWAGVRHFAGVHLFALDGDEQGRLAAPEDNGLTSNWKWPYVDSWYYPGASIAVFPAWGVGLPTLQPELDVHYAVDWQRVFEKAWPDMPRDPIAIEAVAFANEIAGVVRLHVAVSDVQQTSSSSSRPNVSFNVNGRARIEADPGQPLHYVWQADNALGVLFSWQTHDSRCSFESPSGLWQPNTPSGALEQSMQTAQSGCIYDIVVTAYSLNGVASDGITVAVR